MKKIATISIQVGDSRNEKVITIKVPWKDRIRMLLFGKVCIRVRQHCNIWEIRAKGWEARYERKENL